MPGERRVDPFGHHPIHVRTFKSFGQSGFSCWIVGKTTIHGAQRGSLRPLKAFNERAAKPPGRWQQVLSVALAIILPVALWDKRGAAVGIVALFVYGGVSLLAAFKHDDVLAWSRRHPALDSLIIVPLAFLALAYLTI